MNIILITNRQGQVWNFRFQPQRLILGVLLGMALLLVAVTYAGYRMGENDQVYIDEWRDVLHQQREELDALRKTARADLDALTLRIGQMQGQLLRLDGLGERLVSQGDLDQAEFDFSVPAAMGGPESIQEGESAGISDILGMLNQLDAGIADREQKLSVLESVLMSRSISARVTPSGRPVADGWISSTYGKRNDPFTGKQDFHHGIDFAGRKESGVVAAGDGVVIWSDMLAGYGNLVEVNHGNGYVTRYGHNQKNLVNVGDTVKKGQQIALMGSTGRSTGPHVHFEVLHNGKTVNPSSYTRN
jgi:murein DD-endopeptidase MepM/ murein hydrolase activator NlpD